MRLRIVVRSLAVILASPLVALPMGQAQTPEATQVAPAVAPAPQRGLQEMLREPSVASALAPRADAAPTEISVACGGDGCVVQNGLEVMVVAGKRAR